MPFCLKFNAPTSVQLPVSREFPPIPYEVRQISIEVDGPLFLDWRRAIQYNAFVRNRSDEDLKTMFLTAYPFHPTSADLIEFVRPYLVAAEVHFKASAVLAREAEMALEEIRARENVKPWSRGGVRLGKKY